MRTLQWKLVLIMALLVATVVAVTGTYLFNGINVFYENSFYGELGDVFTADFFDELRRKDSAEITEFVSAKSNPLGLNSNRVFVLFDASLSYIAGSDRENGASVEKTGNLISALNGELGQESGRFGGYYDIAAPFEGRDGEYILYIRDNKADVAELSRIILSIMVQALLLGFFVSVLMSILLSKTISGPIENVTKSARKLAEGDYEGRLDVHSDDEIGVLTETFNKMAQTLTETLQSVERESDKLSTLFSHMTDGVVAADRGGRVIHYNSAAVAMLSIEDANSESFDALFEDTGITVAAVLALRDPNFTETVMSRGGKDVRAVFSPFGTEERSDGVIAVLYDVTEQQRLEKSRREFVADISHELRTPLTNIKSYAETLLGDCPEGDCTNTRFLEVIINETDRMTRLTRDLLTLSKLDYGRTDWNLEVFSPAPTVQNIVDAMSIEAQRRGLALEAFVGEGLPEILADKGRLEQVLANVLGNSVKYTPEGGHIAVRAEREEGGLRVTVRDDGIGVPEQDLPHIFDRFYRVEKARSRERGGSGLGLAIAKEFTEMMNGSISLESAPGRGTEVTIRLPAFGGKR